MITVDMELVKKAQKGDENAFTRLIMDRNDDMYRLAYIYTKNSDDSLEVLHNIIYKACLSIKKLKEPKFFNTWLFRITVNCCIDFLTKNDKKLKNEKQLSEIEDLENLEDITDQYEDLINKLDVGNAIDKLNINQKNVILLKYYKDMTLLEISDVLECPLGTIKSRLNSALGILRDQLKEEYI